MGDKRTLRDESTPIGRQIWAAVDKAAAKAPVPNPTPKPTAEEDARIERVARIMTLMKVGATRQALEKAAELVQKKAWSLGDRRRLPPMIRALAKEQTT